MDHFSKLLTGNAKYEEEFRANKAYAECNNYIEKREQCWNNSQSESKNADCFEEELAEKKCLASHLCPELYKKFYEYSECHLWAAAFRKKNNDMYIEARSRINSDPALSKMCRELGLELSKDLSNYSQYRTEASEGNTYIENSYRNKII